MTEYIEKSMHWMVQQIKSGVDWYLEIEREAIMNSLSKFILESIIQSACSEYADHTVDENGELLIRIGIPVPEDCRLILDDPAIMKEILEE